MRYEFLSDSILNAMLIVDKVHLEIDNLMNKERI